MKELNRTTANLQKKFPIKVLQFGGGNFLRGFTDWMIDWMNEKLDFQAGVLIIKPTKGNTYKELRNQEGLYHVILDGIERGALKKERRLINCVQEVIHPYVDFSGFLSSALYSDIKLVISNTTESGIAFNPEDKFTDAPPREFPAKLAIWLYHRYQNYHGEKDKGVVIIPTELIEQNGDYLKECILKYAEHWNSSTGFIDWIHNACTFCNTLVDRIVSGFPKERQAELTEEIGYDDHLLVAGEWYHSWVIQGSESAREAFPADQAGLNVRFVPDLKPYRELKVRILNGAHTSMVPLAYMGGLESVREAISDPTLGQFIQGLLLEEVLPTLNFPAKEKEEFMQSVLDRFKNPSIHHKLIDIALNSTSKFKTRLLPSLIGYHKEKGKLPRRIVLALAALVHMYRGTREGEPIPLRDNPDRLSFFHTRWQAFESTPTGAENLAEQILANQEIWEQDLNQIEGLKALLAQSILDIEENGTIKSSQHLLSKGTD